MSPLHPYRTPSPREEAPPAAAETAWQAISAPMLIVTSGPLALVMFCAAVRAFVDPVFMPSTVLYAALAYAASVAGVCLFDLVGRAS
jgi:hypothetical protein